MDGDDRWAEVGQVQRGDGGGAQRDGRPRERRRACGEALEAEVKARPGLGDKAGCLRLRQHAGGSKVLLRLDEFFG